MSAEDIKVWFTYLIALLVIVGGAIFLFLIRGEDNTKDLQLAIVGFMGGALSYVFTRESASQATKAARDTQAATVLTGGNGTPAA